MQHGARSVSRTYRMGKTVTISLAVDEQCRVAEARVTGDFFVYPPEALEAFERRLRGCSSAECIEEAQRVLEEAETLGFSPAEVVEKVLSLYRELCSPGSGREARL
ncbi:MAG: biotin--protein ligase [Crenarchaeota archaeon]|nr:biotin--protein ligase [Thermoproteota archaeon]